MGFFCTSSCDLIPSQGSNERPLSRIRPLASNTALRQLSPRAPTCDPCRGFGSSDPVRFSTGSRCSHDGHNAPQDASKTPPGRPKPTPVPRAATMLQDVLETPPPRRPHLQQYLQQHSFLLLRLSPHCDCRGRPSSMYMWSPHDIGRESWVWEEQEALKNVSSPHKVGEEALAEWSHSS